MKEGDHTLETQAGRIVETCIAYRTRRLNRVITRLYNDHLSSVGINVSEMNLLAAIAANEGAQASDLSRAMEIEKSTMSRNLKRMEDRGWVSSEPNPEGRGELVTLTDIGEALLQEAMPAWEYAQERASDILERLPSAQIEGGVE